MEPSLSGVGQKNQKENEMTNRDQRYAAAHKVLCELFWASDPGEISIALDKVFDAMAAADSAPSTPRTIPPDLPGAQATGGAATAPVAEPECQPIGMNDLDARLKVVEAAMPLLREVAAITFKNAQTFEQYDSLKKLIRDVFGNIRPT